MTRLTVRLGLIQIRFVVERNISHNGMGNGAFPLPDKAAKNGKTAKRGSSHVEMPFRKFNVHPVDTGTPLLG